MNAKSQAEFILAGVLMKHLLLVRKQKRRTVEHANPHSRERKRDHLHDGRRDPGHRDGRNEDYSGSEAMFLSRGIPHQLINRSGRPAHYTLLCTPSGFEGFVAEGGYSRKSGEQVQPPTAEDVARMQDAAPRFGITLLPGW